MRLPRWIYAIQHNVTKKIYIGSSAHPDTRYWAHIGALRRGQHQVPEMQQDFDDYGEDYSFFILEQINDFGSRNKEYEWMEKYQTGNTKFGYNIRDRHFNNRKSKYAPLKKGLPKMPAKNGN